MSRAFRGRNGRRYTREGKSTATISERLVRLCRGGPSGGSPGIEFGEPFTGGLGFTAGRIESDHFLIQLFGVWHVHLPLFELSRLEQFFRLVAGASGEGEGQQYGGGGHRCDGHAPV